MKKKTIQPVTFSEVYTEVREQVMNECVRQFSTTPGYNGNPPSLTFSSCNVCLEDVD